jgi:hypothetical protein
MTVRIRKSDVDLRDKVSELDRPIGIGGQSVLSSETIQDAQNVLGVGRKNLFINGGFDFWTRGTSQTGNGYGSADRWANDGSGATVTFSRQEFSLGDNPTPANRYYARYAVTTGNDRARFYQRVENGYNLYGRTVTLSFWARQTGNRYMEIDYISNLNGSLQYNYKAAIVNIGTDWQRYSVSFTIKDRTGTRGSDDWIEFRFGQGGETSTAGYTWDITAVQLELGEVATPFEARPLGEELALCQRYYYRAVDGVTMASLAYGRGAGGGLIVTSAISLPVPMRSEPSIEQSGTYHITDHNARTQATPTSVISNVYTENSSLINLYFTFSSQVCVDDRVCIIGFATNGTLSFNAEI